MDLATRQRHLRDLIKGRPVGAVQEDPYLETVAHSPGLTIVREIVLWWRAIGLERSCPLTTAALKRLGLFDESLVRFVREKPISPYVDELARAFLIVVGRHPHPLPAAVAQFEHAVLTAKAGDAGMHIVLWRYDPVSTLSGLLEGLPIADRPAAVPTYRTIVSRQLPELFRVEPIID